MYQIIQTMNNLITLINIEQKYDVVMMVITFLELKQQEQQFHVIYGPVPSGMGLMCIKLFKL